MTSAYGGFANDGVVVPYRSILEVQDSNGNILQQAATSTPGTQAIPAQTARQINDILSDQTPGVMMSSIKALVAPMDRPVAIKTGTTNDDRDVWAIGYTPNLVIGTWAGKNDDTPMDTSGTAGLIITPTWAAEMTEALQGLPVENFKAPNPTPSTDKPVLRGIWQGGVSYKIDTISGKLATQYTPAATTKEIVFTDVHSILNWLDPSDPLGPAPADPSTNPQYPYWEYAVQQWLTNTYEPAHPDFKEVPIADQIIPTETDDIHVPANFPTITITSPTNGVEIDPSQKLTVNFAETGKYPLQNSELYINGNYITTNNTNSTTFSFIPNDIESVTPGINSIEIVGTDSVFDQGSATSTFNIGGSVDGSTDTSSSTSNY
jgi:membrane peptidoglycan carboxypeptidase